jgi:hypothetical protein
MKAFLLSFIGVVNAYRLIMKTILVFNDNSAEAANAAEFAVAIAQKVKADILLLNLLKLGQNVFVPLNARHENAVHTIAAEAGLTHHLYHVSKNGDFKPAIWDIDASEFTIEMICGLVISKNIWLMVKGLETSHVTHAALTHLNVQSVLNRVACPLLLIPDKYKQRYFENIAYAVDMRYFRPQIARFLAELAEAYHANLNVEHLSAKGLPHLDDHYALTLFNDQVKTKINYGKIYFNNIKERNLEATMDVIVNTLHADLLALANHRFHFEEIFGQNINDSLPGQITIPVIIFPC